jgi:hypothetical protein
MAVITGRTLIAWGHAPGPWFAAAIAAAEEARHSGADSDRSKQRRRDGDGDR